MAQVCDLRVILLAAGASQRMGDVNKLLLPVNGTSMVRHSADLYLNLGFEVCVVTGHQASRIVEALGDLPVRTVHNNHHARGHNSSVFTGLHATSHDLDALIALADQPHLTSQDIDQLRQAYIASGRTDIMVPVFNGARGNPVILPKAVCVEICSTTPPTPPREFMRIHPDRVQIFEASNAHFTTDIDTPEDVATWL